MQVRVSLRFIFIIASICALALAVQIWIAQVIIPDNVKTATTICNAIGAEYERTGQYPRSSLLKWSDIEQDYGLAIKESAKTGTTENRWGEEIGLIVAVLNNPNGQQYLDLSVVSKGPFGLGYASYGDLFEYHVNNMVNSNP